MVSGDSMAHGRVVEINKIIEDEMCCRVLYSNGDSEDMSYATVIEQYDAHCDGRFIALLDSIIPVFKYLEDRLTDNFRSLAHGCLEIHRLLRCSPRSLFSFALCLTLCPLPLHHIGPIQADPSLADDDDGEMVKFNSDKRDGDDAVKPSSGLRTSHSSPEWRW